MIQYSTSDDGGATWGGPFRADDPDTVFEARDPDLAVAPSGDVWLIYNGALVTEEEKRDGLLRQISDDDGTSWSPAEVVQGGFCCQNIAGTPEGLVLTWWQGEFIGEPFNYWNDDVHYRTTEDEGATWPLPIRYTMYPGQDVLPSVAGLDTGGFALAWRSDRRRGDSGYTTEQAIWFGDPQPKSGGDVVTVETQAVGDLVSAHVEYSVDGEAQPDVPMSDEGNGRFSAALGSFEEPGTFVEYRVRVEDTNATVMRSFSRGFEVVDRLVKAHDVLLVVDDRDRGQVQHISPYYRRALDEARVGHDFWDTSVLGPPAGGRPAALRARCGGLGRPRLQPVAVASPRTGQGTRRYSNLPRRRRKPVHQRPAHRGALSSREPGLAGQLSPRRARELLLERSGRVGARALFRRWYSHEPSRRRRSQSVS